MLVRGKVKKSNGNEYTVEVPLFENPEDSFSPTVSKAVLAVSPGIYAKLNDGDVVFVEFENNDYGTPVILGKLSTVGAANATQNLGAAASVTSMNCKSLTVTTSAAIPSATTIVYPKEEKKPVSIVQSIFGTNNTTVEPVKYEYVKNIQGQGDIIDPLNPVTETIQMDTLQHLADIILDLTNRVTKLEETLAQYGIVYIDPETPLEV